MALTMKKNGLFRFFFPTNPMSHGSISDVAGKWVAGFKILNGFKGICAVDWS
jgi:hypothetical protein